jgi:hypothetical protein
MGRKFRIPKGGIKYKCQENDNTIIVFKNGADVDELYFGNTDMLQDGWLVIGYKDLMAAIEKANGRT